MSQVINVPSPHEVVSAIMPLVLTGATLVVAGFVVLGPVGRAIGRVILHVFGVDRQQGLPPAEAHEMRTLLLEQGERLEAVQRQVSDLAERQDFAERLLAQARERRLPQGGG